MTDSAEVRVGVTPSAALIDDPPRIVVSGCPPSRPLTVRARMRDGLGRQWESHADFEADGGGAVDVSARRPITGTYDGVDGQPGLPATVTASLHPLAERSLAFGGSPKDNAAAAADSWPKVLALFRDALAN